MITVVMAAYRAEKWVVAAVESVLSQQLPDGWSLELLVCVDGCPETAEALEGLQDPRMGVVVLDRNYGTYIATNTVLRMSRGSLLTCMGADDIMLPTRLLKLIGVMEKDPQVGLAGAWHIRTDENLRHVERRNSCGDGTWMHRRSILLGKLGGFMPWKCGADTEAVLRTKHLGYKRIQVREHLYLHRQHPKQLTRDPATSFGSTVRKEYIRLIEKDAARYKRGAVPQRINTVTGEVAALWGLFRPEREWVLPEERVEVSMASIPSREQLLRGAVQSLLHQVDRVNVYLNEYPHVPAFLSHPKIRVARSQQSGNRGDAGKFFWSGSIQGYHLTADDDITYPPGYVHKLVSAIDHYGRRAVLTFHGTELRPDVKTYYRDRVATYRCLHAVAGNRPVHVGGTGVMGYHTSTVRVTPKDFKHPNMADVWMGLLCQEQGVPCVVLGHPAGWIKSPWVQDTIWRKSADHKDGSFMDSSKQQDAAVQSIRWKLLPIPCFGSGW